MGPASCSALAASLFVLLAPAVASALPGDPPVEALAPADGASVRAGSGGITVAYTCPAYTSDVYGDPANPTVDRRDASDYQVTFSDRSDPSADGLLAGHGFPSATFGAQPEGDGTCTSTLPDDYVPLATKYGRVYWQASRSCLACMPQHETGPVRSFVVRLSVSATLTVPKRLYAGYLGAFSLRSTASLADARVVLERRSGGHWSKVTDEPYHSDATKLFGKLPAGRHTVRAVIRTGSSSFTVATKTLTVRREARRSTSRGDDGTYRAAKPAKNSTLRFTVAGGGRLLKGFKASVTTFCVGPTPSDNRLYVVFALLNTVRIAPDGTVVGVLRSSRGGREILTGRLSHGHLTGASIDVSLSTCNGERKFTAVRR